MKPAPNRGRGASATPNRGRGRGRGNNGAKIPYIGQVNGYTYGPAAHADSAIRRGQPKGKRGNGVARKGILRQNDAMNHSLDELLPGSDDEQRFQPTSIAKSQTLEERAARFSAHSNEKNIEYEELKKSRIREREIAIKKGLIDDPNKPRNLQDAIQFIGTCQDMCPKFERLERELQHGLDSLEKAGNADPEKCVKTYRRSAAGNEQPLPSDVRPPAVLECTLDYLFNVVLATHSIEDCHIFIRDRTRAVRKDFGVQNIVNMDAVRAFERIARFHILSLHEMCEMEEEKFSEQQETEQLRKVMVSLAEFYEDLSKVGIYSENEPEFRAYQIISYIRDQDVIRWAQTLRVQVFSHPLVQRALEFHALAQRNNEMPETGKRRNKPTNCEAAQNFYTRFFKLIADKDTTFLMGCMLETQFPDIRRGALKAMNKTYNPRLPPLPAVDVQKMLAYDTIDDCLKEAEFYGIIVNRADPNPSIHFGKATWPEPTNSTQRPTVRFVERYSNPKPKKSHLLVEPKKSGTTFSQIINQGLGSGGIQRESKAIPIVKPPTTSYFDKPKNIPSIPLSSMAAPPAPTVTRPMATSAVPAVAVPALPFSSQVKPGFFARANVEAMEQKYKPALTKQEQQSDAEKLKAKQETEERARKNEEEARKNLEAEEKARKAEAKRRQEEEIARQMAQAKAAQAAEAERLRRMEEAKKEEEIAKMKADQEAHLKVLAQTRKMAIVSQLQHRLCNEVLQEVIDQQVRKVAINRYFELRRVKRVVDVWRVRTQNKVTARKEAAKRLERIRHTISRMSVANPTMIPSDNIDVNMTDTTTDTNVNDDAYDSVEEFSQHLIREIQQETKWRDQLWQKEDFSQYLYPSLKPNTPDALPNSTTPPQPWNLLIAVESWDSQPAQWIRHKFDMDNITGTKHIQHPPIDFSFQSVQYDADLDQKLLLNTGAMIFQLSDQRRTEVTDLEDTDYWAREKARFHSFMKRVQNTMPQLRVPVVILYWPLKRGIDTELQEKIPLLLNVYRSSVATDHRVVVMTPQNACEDLPLAIQWLGENGRKLRPFINTVRPEVYMHKLWEEMNWTIGYVYQQLSETTTTVDDTIQGMNYLISTHNEAMEQVRQVMSNEVDYDQFKLPTILPQASAGRTVTSADLYLLHTEWLSQINFKLPDTELPTSPQDMCFVFSTVSGSVFHVIQHKLVTNADPIPILKPISL